MKKIYILLSSFFALILLGVFCYTLAVGKLPSWNLSLWSKVIRTTNQNTNSSTQSSLTFSNTKAGGIPGRIYIFREHQLLSYDPLTEKTEPITTFTNDVTAVTVSPNLDVYAYLSTKDNKDTLYFRRRGLAKDVTVFTADHSYTGEEETKSTHLTAPIRFSPDGRYVIARQVFWEGCGDVVINVATTKVVATMLCESLVWSTDGRRVAIGNGSSYDGPISFMFGVPADLTTLRQVDWKTMTGDNADFLDDQQQPVWANAWPAFADDGTILLMVTWTGTPSATTQGSALYRYIPKDNSIRRLIKFPVPFFNGAITVSGNQALPISNENKYLVDLKTNTYRTIGKGIDNVGTGSTQFFRGLVPFVIQSTSYLNTDGGVSSSTLTLLNLDDFSADEIFYSMNDQFAGWSPIYPASRDLEFIHQEFQFADLTAAKQKSLESQIENVSLYKKDATETLGGLDCSTGGKHDQLQALNDAVKGTLKLNDGLQVTITPNLYHWNNVDMETFISDESVVCGVATTVPKYISGDIIYWWTGCVGGAGIGQPGYPYFDQSIRCVQAEDVIQRHFSLQ